MSRKSDKVQDKQFHYIYMIVNQHKDAQKFFYIGKRSSRVIPEKDRYKGSGIVLNQAYEKYGRKNFKKLILAECETEVEAYELEAFLVDEEWVNDPRTMNIKVGGKGGFSLNFPTEESLKKRSETNTGSKWINNGVKQKRVKGDILEQYLKDGWVLGGILWSEEKKKKKNKKAKQTRSKSVWMHKGDDIVFVKKEKRKQYEEEGYVLGKKHTKETVKKISDNSHWKGKHRSEEVKKKLRDKNKGKRWMMKNDNVKMVFEKDIDQHLEDGWIFDYPEMSKSQRENQIKSIVPRKWINKNKKNRFVPESELDDFLNDGWDLGKYLTEKQRKKISDTSKNRVVKQSTRDKISKISSGRRWVNDGVICKFVLKTEVDDYLDKGWKLGNGNCRSNK